MKRVIVEHLDTARFEGVTSIGIDEFSYRKHHRYITVVVDHDRKRVIWAGEGQDASAANAFFDLLGEERCSQIQLVTNGHGRGLQEGGGREASQCRDRL